MHTRFYYGREGYYPLKASTKENGVFLGAFLPVFGLWGGPPWSELGGMVVLDTKEGVDSIEALHTRFYYGRERYYL